MPTENTIPNAAGHKAYKYTYDKLNRLLTGNYGEISGTWWFNNNYSELIDNGSTAAGYKPYDLNGNIQSVNRYGWRANTFATIDELKYTYDGNKLIAVDNVLNSTNYGGDFIDGNKYSGTAEYTYDANGNLTKDANKGISSITYNYLTLPVSINKSGGTHVEYSYDAAGTKREQRHYINGNLTKTTSFYTNFVYENSEPARVSGRVLGENYFSYLASSCPINIKYLKAMKPFL